jgi:homospermidine synthase
LRASLVKKPTFELSDDPLLIARFPRKDERRNFCRLAPLSGMKSMHTKNLYWGIVQ